MWLGIGIVIIGGVITACLFASCATADDALEEYWRAQEKN